MKGLTNRERIEIVLEFYHSRGVNKENVNELYRKILNNESKEKYVEMHKFYCLLLET
jgi:hypothetical protein